MAEIISKKDRISRYKHLISSLPIPREIGMPSDFAEKNIILTRDVSPIVGKYSYRHTPQWRGVADCAHPSHPAKIIFVVKGAQSGATQGVVIPVSVWTVAENPCNFMVTSGNEVLSKDLVSTRFDPAIKSAGFMHLLKPNVIRAKNAKSGNTDSHKQFSGGNGFFVSIGAIDTVGKQKSLTLGLFDDFSASDIADKRQGNLFNLLQPRFNTSSLTQKQFYISTCETSPDPTYIGYLKGNQCKFHVPCPCCGKFIVFEFSIDVNGKRCGIIYDTDDEGKLVEGSVKYKCQRCYAEFEEREKYKMMDKGQWFPTAKPIRPDWYSFHISGLYGAASFDGWDVIVREWIDIFAEGSADTDKLKTFNNLRLGVQYEDRRENIESSDIMQNSGGYEHATVPFELAEIRGCGRIVMLTMGSDCHGTVDDGRIDNEVVAWTENGQSFSIDHFSIGTFSNNKKIKNDENRIKWTYRDGYSNSIWDEIVKRANYEFPVEGGGTITIQITAIDEGHMGAYVRKFADSCRIDCIMVKGAPKEKAKLFVPRLDIPLYRKSANINGLVLIETNFVKEEISKHFSKKWPDENFPQPTTFCNFPDSTTGKYQNSFYSQLTGEEKVPVIGSNGSIKGYEWKIKTNHENHFFDCRCYAYVGRQVYIDEFLGKPKSRFVDYCKVVFGDE